MTMFQDNAAEFATTVEDRIDHERRAGIEKVLACLREGRRGRAHYELARSVERQARVAGCRPSMDLDGAA